MSRERGPIASALDTAKWLNKVGTEQFKDRMWILNGFKICLVGTLITLLPGGVLFQFSFIGLRLFVLAGIVHVLGKAFSKSDH